VPDHADYLPKNSRLKDGSATLKARSSDSLWRGTISSFIDRQITSVSERQLMHTIQKDIGQQLHASSDKPLH